MNAPSRMWRKHFDERGLRWLFGAFFLALAVPAALLVAQAYGQLKWEALRTTQLAAEELAARIDAQLVTAVAGEDARSFGDYSFLVVTGDAAANFVQRSPLSAFPVASSVPGVLGYFQLDAAGKLSTPLLPGPEVAPASYGIGAEEQAARAARIAELRAVLAQNHLVRPARDEGAPPPALADKPGFGNLVSGGGAAPRAVAPAAPPPAAATSAAATSASASASAPTDAQAAFDQLAAGALSKARAANAAGAAEEQRSVTAEKSNPPERQQRADTKDSERRTRVEQALAPEPKVVAPQGEADSTQAKAKAKAELDIRTFASEIDPLELGMLDTGHFVLFRNVWRDGQRYIQGALLDRAAFLASTVEAPYRTSAVAGVTDLAIAHQGRTLAVLSAGGAPASYASTPQELAGTVVHRTRLSPPFGDLEIAFSVNALPRAPGTTLLIWVSVTLAVVLIGGFLLMYRFAAGQLRLARQQQDFVSAVSHELKTPLTSIRMYGEMLKAGWADEAKKQTYYDYIQSESERLSRLIDNVLQLARLTRSSQRIDAKSVLVTELLDLVRSKVATQVERAGFELRVRNDTPAETAAVVDADCFAQIFINLVDNALKFSAGADVKVVELACRSEPDGSLLFTVRDFGPGVPKAQMKKIFELFYRAENELTRETVGTGIGLALVRQLAMAMNARIDVRNCEPGAEFRLSVRS
ncbi:MAG: HAMP domain-containing sensor histidine kinase [Gammaproteobacteria bacterium]